MLSKAKQSKAKQSKAKPLLYLLTNNFKFYISQFFKYFFSVCKNLLNTFTIVIPSICQNAKESRLNKIRFYNLASLNIGLPRLLAKSRNDYFANLNNKVAFASALQPTECASLWEAPCVLFHELLTQGLKTTLLYNFLTFIKFNFDSLSRKIKNPCLVINKNLFQNNANGEGEKNEQRKNL